jgi:glycosyltransferase involved in cell wall biosynthesis
MELPLVSILMPIRDERNFIERSLRSVLAQDYPTDRLEILVVDGMSTDGTRRYIEAVAADRPDLSIRLLDNPQKIVATGLNIGTREARGEILLRVDGHCEIGGDHVRRCVELLSDSRQAPAGVGGPVESVSSTVAGAAIAAAMSSRFGVGGSAFRVGVKEPRLSDTIPFPAYPKATLAAAGPYDEELVRNQDDEYNYRIRSSGGQLLLDPRLRSRYYSRASLGRLWRQYREYGLWKVRVLQKHPRQMSARQFAPAALIAALLVGGVLALIVPDLWPVPLLIGGSYVVANLLASVGVALNQGARLLPALPGAFAALHFGYGLGFLFGLFRFWNRWGDRSTLVDGKRQQPGEWSEAPE